MKREGWAGLPPSELLGELRQRGVHTWTPVAVSQAAENLMALIRDGAGGPPVRDDSL